MKAGAFLCLFNGNRFGVKNRFPIESVIIELRLYK